MKKTSLIFCLCVSSSILQVKGWVKSNRFTPDVTRVYKSVDDVDLDLHIFYPNSSKPAAQAPAILLFHGGGFSKGGPGHFYYLCDYLASRGMVAISVRYRINNDNIECLKDAKSAMRYVRKHATLLGIDPDRIVAGGGSAGGCLAAALSTSSLINDETDDVSISLKPAALVLFNPVYHWKGKRGYPKEIREDFTPMDNIHSGMAPNLVMFGDLDKHLDVPSMKKFQKEMQEAGVRSELEVYPGEKHAFFNKSREIVVATVRRVDVFLTSLGFLSGEPTVEAWAEALK